MTELSIEEYESIVPVATIGDGADALQFYVPTRVVLMRAQTLYTKEPNTIEWLSKMPDGVTFMDIGANVGVYSLLAAKRKSAQVFAFEPESLNFAILNRNIVLNRMGDAITPYCVALGSSVRLAKLHLSQFMPGGSFHTAQETSANHLGQPMQAAHTQGCMIYTLDRLVQEQVMPVPDFVKIDVDGLEHEVINGMRETLASGGVQSILFEANKKMREHCDGIAALESLGFEHDAEYSERHRAQEGKHAGTGNMYFYRKDYPHPRVKDAPARTKEWAA